MNKQAFKNKLIKAIDERDEEKITQLAEAMISHIDPLDESQKQEWYNQILEFRNDLNLLQQKILVTYWLGDDIRCVEENGRVFELLPSELSSKWFSQG